MQFNIVVLAVSAFAVSASAAAYNATQPTGTGVVAPSASGAGSAPAATGSPITGAAGMNTISGSALGFIVAGGIALAL
ncbi:MAG: hypothetical protein M1830_003433 [Pleopsidium flavum]|nr:MAG: hypothetical protein M1830_003433 [Pleopsidium flavum]